MKTILELLHLESIDADLTFSEHLRLAQYKEERQVNELAKKEAMQ